LVSEEPLCGYITNKSSLLLLLKAAKSRFGTSDVILDFSALETENDYFAMNSGYKNDCKLQRNSDTIKALCCGVNCGIAISKCMGYYTRKCVSAQRTRKHKFHGNSMELSWE
jgi:hypothetical protein